MRWRLVCARITSAPHPSRSVCPSSDVPVALEGPLRGQEHGEMRRSFNGTVGNIPRTVGHIINTVVGEGINEIAGGNIGLVYRAFGPCVSSKVAAGWCRWPQMPEAHVPARVRSIPALSYGVGRPQWRRRTKAGTVSQSREKALGRRVFGGDGRKPPARYGQSSQARETPVPGQPYDGHQPTVSTCGDRQRGHQQHWGRTGR